MTLSDVNLDGSIDLYINGSAKSKLLFNSSSGYFSESSWLQNMSVTYSNAKWGDVNMDGIINIQDIVQVVNFIMMTATPTSDEYTSADLNGDDMINVSDIVLLVNLVLNPFSSREDETEEDFLC